MFHPATHRGADGMFYVAAAVYSSAPWRPMTRHRRSPHRTTALGQGPLSRQAGAARKGHTLKVHGCLCRGHTSSIQGQRGLGHPQEAHRDAGFAPVMGGGSALPVAISRENSTQMPKIGCRVKNTNKANPPPPWKAHHAVRVFVSIC